MIPIGIRAVGAHVPARVVTNEEVAAWSGASAEHIGQRTGISERRYAEAETPTSALAHEAVADLLHRQPDASAGLGALIVATSTGDQPQPPTAAVLHRRMGAPVTVAAWDLNAVCSGGLFGVIAGAAHASISGRPVLVVAADKYSGIVRRSDWRTTGLFGDAAGAAVLGRVPEGFGLLAFRMISDGAACDLVRVPGGGSARPLSAERLAAGEDRFGMDGREVRRWVFEALPALIAGVLADAGHEADDVERWIFHQANPRMLGELADLMQVPRWRVPLMAPMYGNSGAASLLVTLAESVRREAPERGDLLLLAAVGGGMSAGAVLLRWW